MALGDNIKQWIKDAEAQKPVPLTDCPICGWTLENLADGRVHCQFCGFVK